MFTVVAIAGDVNRSLPWGSDAQAGVKSESRNAIGSTDKPDNGVEPGGPVLQENLLVRRERESPRAADPRTVFQEDQQLVV
jgi:hypothetical protein